jgi:WXG100 family type VII secretion target
MPSGNPGQLEQLADALDQHASRVTDVAKATAAVTGLVRTDAEWTGQAADSYSQFTGEFTSRIGRVAPPLNQIATAVRGYATALRTAQQQVTAYNNIVESPEAASGQITPTPGTRTKTRTPPSRWCWRRSTRRWTRRGSTASCGS